MHYKIMLSLMVILMCQNILPMDQAIRIDGFENNKLVVNFLVALSADKKLKEHIQDFRKWREERIGAYKTEYHISASDRIIEDVYTYASSRKNGKLNSDCCFSDYSRIRIIPIAASKYEINCSCQYEGYPEWKLRAFGGYVQAEVETMAEQIIR
ncbi:MAG: hypothetical protein Q8Q60_01030 [Candidatus Chromulinivorax sp.]|nr:hypothetical protein [Candidatus Chromulinivorax sp.]